MENIYEQFFFLKYWGGWSLSEAYNLPVGLREWFLKRLMHQLEEEQAAMNQGGGGNASQVLSAQNQPPLPPQARYMQKKNKS
jgi:hypothetical protein